ncbi:MAG TPA: 2-succinyl-5-enolpyruvyl-6-hydroxy-3-cyclohexene-1-carboxylic-acid synthase [Solirubrobacteraceae bacterium]|jgi:2-succinyl-5-enolpyruvyl-6-hydroxy-3-cyclohexene-1-carboxylate synthase|nr:2-succinyl-5-enolpyruvyl-6-hydroxy-3-cyclohexene-1-carboxylic-acid synthase [Solirubrobacteraceae bacterium]
MTSATDTYELLGAFVDELARCGMHDACTSPGSRSTPLVLSLAREQRLRCHSHIDERCSGFFALGLAKASGLPVAIACTSGTAVAELLPAIVEAHEARVPLIVLSADRPPELRELGAGQTIDQLKIFGDFAKWFFEVGTHEADSERLRWMRTLACRAWWTALEGRPGVVHLNFPLREPLVRDELPEAPGEGRDDGRPYVIRPAQTWEMDPETALAPGAIPSSPVSTLLELVRSCRRGVLVAGRYERGTPLGHAAARFCELLGWPLLADPMSGARRGDAAVAHYDALLREPGFVREHTPDFILRVGDLPVSKPLRTWLADLTDTPQFALDPEGAWQDPAGVLSSSLALEPAAALSALTDMLEGSAAPDSDWLGSWRSADELTAEAILGVLAASGCSEPSIAAELGVLLPEEATLFVASSMPVRDIETFWPVRPDPPRVLCNRGANGIDGTVSSAFGAAAASRDPVVLLIGDVALAYDISALLAARRLDLKLTIVLIDNEGGGIFDFLPVAEVKMARGSTRGVSRSGDSLDDQGSEIAPQDIYTRHIATPTGLDFAQAATLYGLSHERVADVAGFRAALEQALAARDSGIIEVRTTRDANVELHRQVWNAVAGALSS